MPLRRLRALILNLPPDAALWVASGSPRQWGWQEHLLAAIEHRSAAANWQRGQGKGRRPKPIRPPGLAGDEEVRHGSAVEIETMRAVLDEWSSVPVADAAPEHEIR